MIHNDESDDVSCLSEINDGNTPHKNKLMDISLNPTPSLATLDPPKRKLDEIVNKRKRSIQRDRYEIN